MPAWLAEPIEVLWDRWRGAFVVAALLALAVLSLTTSWSQRLPPTGLPAPTPTASPIASGDPFAKALALARAGMDSEALTEAKTALGANPQATLPPELSRLIVPDRDDPFNVARGLAIAGFDDKAKEEVAKQLSARPERTVPPELRYLSQRPFDEVVLTQADAPEEHGRQL